MNFDQKMLRLKQCLNVTTDKQVAEALGMEKSALAERKRRGAFPEDKVRALAGDKPDLKIDIAYVITGKSQQERAVEAAASAMSGVTLLRVAEKMPIREYAEGSFTEPLINNWRRCSAADRLLVETLAARLAESND